MDTSSEIYKATAAVNKARKDAQIWDHPLKEQYMLDNFYAFSRGEFLVCLTNGNDQVSVTVPQTPFADGTTVCNIFNDSDCQQVQGGNVNVTLENGEAKIYVPQKSAEEELFLI